MFVRNIVNADGPGTLDQIAAGEGVCSGDGGWMLCHFMPAQKHLRVISLVCQKRGGDGEVSGAVSNQHAKGNGQWKKDSENCSTTIM